MFQPRQFLKRPSTGSATSGTAAPAKVEDPGRHIERHPAMRGLDVSPVHGRHCNCGRCEQHSRAA